MNTSKGATYTHFSPREEPRSLFSQNSSRLRPQQSRANESLHFFKNLRATAIIKDLNEKELPVPKPHS